MNYNEKTTNVTKGDASADKKVSQLDVEIGMLRSSTQCCATCILRLQDKLSRHLRDEVTCKQEGKPSEALAPAAADLREIRSIVDGNIALLESISDRLEC